MSRSYQIIRSVCLPKLLSQKSVERFVPVFLLGFAFISAMPAHAWDEGGHMLVDEIAWKQMRPTVRSRAAEMLSPLDARFNDNRPYTFITAGCWMDDMRGLGKEYKWAKLHYIDIPWTATGAEIKLPPPPHVLSAMDERVKTLRDASATPAQRTEALAMLIHFVGDLHQPLHATERNLDRGGNSYLIGGVPFSDLKQRQISNLHTFWDKAYRFDGIDGSIVEKWKSPGVSERPTTPGEGVIGKEAAKIEAEFPRAKLPELAAAGDGLSWAKQTHLVGCLHAYPAGEPPPNTEVRLLEPAFVHEANGFANRQIALAGYRLGDLLNSLLAP